MQPTTFKLRGFLLALVTLAWCSLPLHAQFNSDFTGGLPAGTHVFGTAVAEDDENGNGALKLTKNVNDSNGSFVLDQLVAGQPVVKFTASFKVRMDMSTCCASGPDARPADGWSFNFASDLPDGVFTPAVGFGSEDGGGHGLTISFDTWDNNAPDTAPSVDLIYNGVVIATQSLGGPREAGRPTTTALVNDPATGQPLNAWTAQPATGVGTYMPCVITLEADGTVDVDWKGVRVINNVQSGYIPVAGRFGFGARTGGANANHFIDDLNIVTYTPGAPVILAHPQNTSVGQGFTATFRVAVDGTPPYTFQWRKNGAIIAGATGSSYTTPPTTVGDNGASFTVEVGGAAGGPVTSNPAILSVVGDGTPPLVTAAIGSPALDQVFLQFNELLNPIADSADPNFNPGFDPFTYFIQDDVGNPLGVLAAAPGADGKSIILTTEQQSPDTDYTISLSDVQDVARNGMPATDVAFHSFVTGVGIFFADFNFAIPPGTSVVGTAARQNTGGIDNSGSMQLAIATGSQQGTYLVGDFSDGQPINQFTASMKLLIGGAAQTGRPADGFAFCFGTDVAGSFGEEGVGNGLRVTLDTWDNNGTDTAPSIEVFYGGVSIANQAMAGVREGGRAPSGPFILDPATGTDMTLNTGSTPASFVDFSVQLYNDKTIDVSFKGVKIFNRLPIPYNTPFIAPTFGFGARTGGAWADHFIDNLLITTFTTGPAVINDQPDDLTVPQGFTASFSVGADGTPPLSYQWKLNGADIAGATGPTFTTAPTVPAMTGNKYSVFVSNPLGSVTSREAVLTVNADSAPPFIAKASGDASFTKIVLTFNEPVQNADDPFQYEVTGPGGVPVSVTAAATSGNNAIVLTTGGLQANTLYTVSGSGMNDPAGNPVLETAPTTITFRSFIFSQGFVRRELYTGRGGVLISDLTSDPNYPNNPSSTDFHTLLEGPLDVLDNYGIRISGYIVPTETALYDFFMSSDDAGDFMISTDSSPANLRMICFEPAWNGTRDWQGTTRRNAAAPENRSTTLFPAGVSMTAGTHYYFELRMKEAGGGDNVGATWTKHGAPLPANGSSPITGEFLAVAADPGSGLGVGFTVNPVSQTVNENQAATFTASASAQRVFSSDFTTAPAGATIYNNGGDGIFSGRIADGFLHLNDAVNSQNNTYIIDDFNGGANVTGFTASFKVSVRNSTCCTDGAAIRPADGFSFNFGTLASGPNLGEEGTGDGLVVSFDTWDSGTGDSDPAISIKYNGVEKGAVAMAEPISQGGPRISPIPADPTSTPPGQPMTIYTGNQFVDCSITLRANGTMDVSYKGVVVLQNVATGYTPRAGRFGFGARTGGANETHWFDDLYIGVNTAVPTPFVKWQKNGVDIPGALGNSYTVGFPQLTDNGSVYRAVASVPGATAFSTGATLNVVSDPTPPTIASVNGDSSLTRVIVVYSEPVRDSAADPFSYSFSGGLNVLGAAKDTSDPLGKTFIITTSRQALGGVYTLTAEDIEDLRENNAPVLTATFRAFVATPAFANMDLFQNIGGVLVSDMTGNPNYPNNPSSRSFVNLIEGPLNAFENYGTRIYGLLRPQVSGPYNFYMSSDDGGAFYLSTDSNPANNQLICSEPIWNGSRDWVGTARRNVNAPENRSTTLFPAGVNLVAGNLYYFELLAKEGGGGDNCAVAWQPPGAPVPANGSSPIGGEFIAALANPNSANITITTQPVDVALGFGCDEQPTIWASDFSSAPAGATIYNNGGDGIFSGKVADGFLHITDNVNGQNNSYVIGDFLGGGNVDSFTAKFKVKIMGSTCCTDGPNPRPADGFSFNFGTLPDGVIGFAGEEGTDNGLVISFDTWDNDANDSAPSIAVRYNNTEKGFVSMGEPNPSGGTLVTPIPADPTSTPAGQPMKITTGDQWVNCEIKLYKDGKVDVSYKGVKVLQGVPSGYAARSGRFGFAARTGGANETHWIDDLFITVNDDVAASAPTLVVVTKPADPLVRVLGVNDGDGNAGDPPANEQPLRAIDGTTQKYLDFLDLGSGVIVTPSMGATIVSKLRLYTANDAIERDPASYLLEGSNAGAAGPWTVISQGALALPDTRNPGGQPVNPATHANQLIEFNNGLGYTSYRVTFPTLKNAAAANSMQIGEVELLGIPAPALIVVTKPTDPLVRVLGTNDGDGNAGDPPGNEQPLRAIDGTTQKYLDFLDLGSGVIVTPSMGKTVVAGLRLYTANDAIERDPASYLLEGSTGGAGGPWTVISQGPLALPDTRNPGGIAINPATHVNQLVPINNTAGYISYRVTFPTLKNAAAANSMQIGEIELLGYAAVSTGALLNESFNSGMGGFTVQNGVGANPANGAEGFTYNAAGGRWIALGGEGVKNSTLNSPVVAVPGNGEVSLSFQHRYFFEDDGTIRWDGGAVYVSKNGGAYTYVEATAFTANGYSQPRLITGNSPPLNGKFGFNGKSTGYDAGTMITSTASLGLFAAGDTLSVRFLGAWDEGYVEAGSDWEIDSVSLNFTKAELATFTVAANGTLNGAPMAPLIQWQRSNGGGAFNNIPGANSGTLTIPVSGADHGAQFRAVLLVPGVTAISDAADLTASQAPHVVITEPANGSTLFAGTTVNIRAMATDSDGEVVSVAFFAGGIGAIGVDNNGADGWAIVVPNAPAGLYVLTAVATDNRGISCDSPPIVVSVVPSLNRPPVASNGSATVLEDGVVNITLVATDPDGNPLTFTAGAAAHGTVTVAGNVATYRPALNYCGPDSFTFTARDPAGLVSNTATVDVAVTCVNDAPICAPVAVTTDEDTAVSIALAATDVDNATLSYLMSSPAHGTLSGVAPNLVYTPAANYNGSDSFTYSAVDAAGLSSGSCTVSITIRPVNDAPTVVIEVSPSRDLGSSVAGITLISPNNVNVCAVLDGSGTFDIEGDAIVSYHWLVDGLPVGDGAIIDACLLVGARTVTLEATDAGGATGTGSVAVDVLSGGEAIEELVIVVNDSVVERKNKRPFIATLKTAAAAFDRGSVGSGLNRLETAFQNKVEAQIGKDNPDVAEEWIRIAQEIIDAYAEPQDCEACQE